MVVENSPTPRGTPRCGIWSNPPPIWRSADRRWDRGPRRPPVAGRGRPPCSRHSNGRVEVRSAPEPALRRRQEAGVHVDGRHVRVRHVRDEADPGGEKARVVLCAVDACREFGEKRPPTVETFNSTFSKTLPFICPRTPPPPGSPSGSVRSHGANGKPRRFPPHARSPRIPGRCGRAAIRTSRGRIVVVRREPAWRGPLDCPARALQRPRRVGSREGDADADCPARSARIGEPAVHDRPFPRGADEEDLAECRGPAARRGDQLLRHPRDWVVRTDHGLVQVPQARSRSPYSGDDAGRPFTCPSCRPSSS